MRSTVTCASPIARRVKVRATSCSSRTGSQLLRGLSGAPVYSRMDRGDDVARSAHLLRPAGHGSVRPRHAGRAADLGAVGRQHHRGARRPREQRSGPRRVDAAFAAAALFAATHPSRTRALVVLDGYADPLANAPTDSSGRNCRRDGAMWGTGSSNMLVNPDMPWNEEIRAAWARYGTSGGQPADRCSDDASRVRIGRAGGPSDHPRARLLSSTTPTTHSSRPRRASTSPSTYRMRNMLSCRAATCYHFVEPWRESFQEIAEFLTGQQADVADDRVLATVLFTDIVDSTRRAAEMGDRDWHALLDAHDAVVRSQLARFRGREVNTSGDGFLAMFDGPQRAIRCAMAIRDAVQALGIEVRAGLHTGECEIRGDDIGGIAVHIGARVSALAGAERGAGVQHAARPGDRVRARVRGPRRARAQGRARRMATLRRRRGRDLRC